MPSSSRGRTSGPRACKVSPTLQACGWETRWAAWGLLEVSRQAGLGPPELGGCFVVDDDLLALETTGTRCDQRDRNWAQEPKPGQLLRVGFRGIGFPWLLNKSESFASLPNLGIFT